MPSALRWLRTQALELVSPRGLEATGHDGHGQVCPRRASQPMFFLFLEKKEIFLPMKPTFFLGENSLLVQLCFSVFLTELGVFQK